MSAFCEKLLRKMKSRIRISFNVYTTLVHSFGVREISLGLEMPIHFVMLGGDFFFKAQEEDK